tara:strand:- start:1150 stop:1806 length:657 start_codon:yes stop_codon:yes gene_type:complete
MVDFSNPKIYPGTGSTVTSLVGSVGDGTIVSSPTFTSNGNASYITTSNTQYVEYASVFDSQSITVISWVYPTSLTNSPAATAARILSRDRSDYWMLGLENGGGLEWSVYHSGGFSYWVASSFFEINTWHQVVGVYDGATGARSVYKNGAFFSNSDTSTATTIGNAGSRPIVINSNVEATAQGTYGMDGRHALHFIYSRALTADQINDNFQSYRGRFGL